MSRVFFARTNHEYQSYADFWRLVELSGYEICYVSEIDPDSDNTYIFTPHNGEAPPHGWTGPIPGVFKDVKARIIHWLLEWAQEYERPPGVAETWVSSNAYAERLGVRYVPMGSHPLLPDPHVLAHNRPRASRYYHLAAMMYWNPRRLNIRPSIERHGVRIAPNAWGYERDSILRDSQAMLHIHQWDQFPHPAPLRFAVAAAYKLPLFSEAWVGAEPLYNQYGMMRFEPGDFFMGSPGVLQEYGEALYEWLCRRMDFKTCVEAAL